MRIVQEQQGWSVLQSYIHEFEKHRVMNIFSH